MKRINIWLICLALAVTAMAQQTDEGKIVVEITKDVNGEKQTFKGEYNSTEEMQADPNYQEFSGDDQGFNFWFDDDGTDAFFKLDQLKNGSSSFFKFFDSEDDKGHRSFFFKDLDGDSIESFLNLHLDDMDLDEYKEHMKGLGIEIEELLKNLDNADASRHMSVKVIKRVKISDVENEFGKRGDVDKRDELVLEDLSFYPNPSPNGQFKVRFETKEEEELSISVSNLEGKEVFSRYFESFSGRYSETIDLSGQKEGIYLLEIRQGKKRLTKKIVIN